MIVEVAVATSRTPKQVYREESYRTLFLTWMLSEAGRFRPINVIARSLSKPKKALPGGRASRTSSRVAAAARAGANKPPPGGELVKPGTVRIHIDDPGAASVYKGSHPAQLAHTRRRR